MSAKILVDFIRDFVTLSELQLMSIRRMMETIVNDIMGSMHAMSSRADDKIHTAREVLVKDGNSEDFKRASAEEADDKATAEEPSETDKARASLEAKLMRSGGVFSKHMEVLGTMDTEVKDILNKVVGAVSIDDVMAQRLLHIIQSVHIVRKGLARVLEHTDNYNTQSKVRSLRNEVLAEIYLSYTAEDEKNIFKKIFGQPKITKKVS